HYFFISAATDTHWSLLFTRESPLADRSRHHSHRDITRDDALLCRYEQCLLVPWYSWRFLPLPHDRLFRTLRTFPYTGSASCPVDCQYDRGALRDTPGLRRFCGYSLCFWGIQP